ncbi:MAG: glycine cleavage system protein H [Proteobacteria bacterium]|nr:glycine cleavage system protein H [Pseudomonadota bacterium]
MEIDDLKYSVEHLWIRLDDDNRATIGVTEEAFPSQMEIKNISLPNEGDEIIKDEVFGRLKTSRPGGFRLYAPISGEVTEVNDEALDAPDVLIEDPYDEGWLVRVEFSNPSEIEDLMTRDEYEDFLDEDALDDEPDDLDDDEDDEDDEF